MTPREIFTIFTLLISLIRSAWFSQDATVHVFSLSDVRASAMASDDSKGGGKTNSCGDFKKEFSTRKGKKLELDLKTGGSIEIAGWSKDVVSISAHGDGGDDCRIEARETDEGVFVRSRYSYDDDDNDSRLRFEVMVPQKYNLAIQTTGGSINIRGVDGKIEGETMGGELELSDLKGELALTTMGGDITLSHSIADGKVETMGGHVRLTDVSGNVKGSSMGGDVKYENVRGNGSSAQDEVKLSSMGGDLELSDAPKGATLNTMGGHIHVGSAADHVKAETMGGDIDLDSVDGWIYAKTMGGDVTARMIGDASHGKRDVDITSYGGDIEVTLPANLSMDFDLEIEYTNHHRDEHQIISDFQVSREESKEWDSDHGTPRKYVYGTGKVNGGANRVHIHTINGNIVLKKG